MAKYCDLVMKGGVTSGVVYPRAVEKLATEYWFKNIGGTSAGAIAAGATAAAECARRRTGKDAGFERLAKLPDDLERDNFLLSLFRPDRQTRRVFEVLLAAMSAKRAHKSVLPPVVTKLCLNFLRPFILTILVIVGLCTLPGCWLGGSWIPYILLALLGCLIGVPCFVL
jgi:hypothetical protein